MSLVVASTRENLGRRMQELYEPDWDEELDPGPADLLRALDRAGGDGG